MTATSRPVLAFPLCLAAVLCALPSGAAAETFRAEYAVTYLGLTVARSTMETNFEGKNYSIEGSVATAGLGRIFDDTKATLSVTGRFSTTRAVPTRAHTDYRHKKKQKRLTITFSGGNVVGTEEVPPPKPRAEDWIPVAAAQLRAVADPMSAFLVLAGRPEEVCAQPLKLFDGEMRLDLALRHEETGSISINGYEGPAVTCSARFQPVSGYRAGKKSVKFMRDKSRISITFAPLGTTGVYAPVRARVGTEIGTLALEARRVEVIE